MRRGKGDLGRSCKAGLVMLALCALVSGCRSNPQRASVEKNLFSEKPGKSHKQDIVERYLVACPDLLQIHIEGRDGFDGAHIIGPDGTIPVGHYGKVRVEGMTLPAAAKAIAEHLGIRPEQVHVRVADFNSRPLLLVGEVVGHHRTISYQGQETVLDVLQRVGGITPGAEPTEIYVVRSHVGDLQRPEVFHVDLQAIVLDRDQSTNIRVRPYDQIYVGETRQARIEKCVPPWFRPAYQKVWNMIPSGKTAQEASHSFTGWIRGWLPFAEPERTIEPDADSAAQTRMLPNVPGVSSDESIASQGKRSSGREPATN